MIKLEKYSVLILYFATIGALGLSFFGSVLNSRLLSKELFGDWKYLQNFLMMISYFVNFGFFASGGRLIASTNDKKRIGIFKGYLMYLCLAGLLVIFLVTVFTGLVWQKMLNQTLFHLALIMFPLFIIHPLTFYFESTFQAERRLIDLSVFKVLPPLLYVGLLYLFKSYSSGSIYYNAVLFYSSYFVIFIFLLLKDKPIFKKKSPEWEELIEQNKTYGIHIFYGGLWGVGTGYLLPILIGFFNINNVEVGNFSLALSFIMPLSFLPGIVGTSYFKEFINLDKIPKAAIKKVLIASIFLLVGLLISIEFLIDFFLGLKYKEVAFLIKVGAWGAILHGFGDFTNKFLSAKGESPYIKKVAMAVGIVQLITSVFFIKYFTLMGWSGSLGAIIAKSIGSVVYFSSLFYYYHKNYIAPKKQTDGIDS